MYTFKNKQYDIIIWDWLYTLYNPDRCDLYQWVNDFFGKLEPNTVNYLVSFAKHPDLRLQKINNSTVAKQFKRIMIDTADKSEAFQKLVAEENLDVSKILVIGDNRDHEGKAAEVINADYVHVWEFAKELGYTHE